MPKRKDKTEILKQRKIKDKKGILKNIIKYLFFITLLVSLGGMLFLTGVYFYLCEELPKISSLTDYRPPIITTVYSDEEIKIAEFFKEKRIVLPLEKMPKMLIEAFLSAEDSRFYKHKGIDIISVLRAFFKNIEAGTIVQGGSTITQQVTKSFFLTPERKYKRKLKEAILAYRIDKTFSKDEILFLYLNQIYFGHGAYGVAAASESYFGHKVQDLSLAECAILAGLPQAPSKYSPFSYPERAKQRQIYVLKRMIEEGYITESQSKKAIEERIDIKPKKNLYIEQAPYYTEHIRRYIERKYKKDVLYNQGLKIYTAINIEMQDIARQEIELGLRDLDKRQGYRGPISHLDHEEIEPFLQENIFDVDKIEPGVIVKGVVVNIDNIKNIVLVRIGNYVGIISIKDMKWARKPNPKIPYWAGYIKHPRQALHVGDVICVKIKQVQDDDDQFLHLALEQEPKVQAALLCIEAGTGHVKAMIGGFDFRDSQFNRAIQSNRQPGSAFKPIIYAAAIDKGYTPASMIIDSPIIFRDPYTEKIWKPKNYKNTFNGPTLLREALAKSLNVVTVKILQDIGIDYVIDYAKKLGITSNLEPNLSIALGSSGISLLEIVKAYSVFDNMGYLVEPVFITKIVDRDGNILEEANDDRKKIIDENTAYIMTSLLESVVQNGTARRVKALDRPAAGKTGTTNDLYDAWFVGYTSRYISGVWVGFDNGGSLGKGETGSRAASPIWLGFMQEILKDKPVKAFPVPDKIVFAKIDAKTGLLPIAESSKTIFECFKEGTIPIEFTQKPNSISKTEQLFKEGI